MKKNIHPHAPRRPAPSYWYMTYVDDGCVICGQGHGTTRERMYMVPRPTAREDRIRYLGSHACAGHFV